MLESFRHETYTNHIRNSTCSLEQQTLVTHVRDTRHIGANGRQLRGSTNQGDAGRRRSFD